MAISIETSSFGNLNGDEVKRYLIKNQNGFEVSLISFGATIQSIKSKDKNGKLVNVLLGLETLQEYLDPNYNRHFGGIIGRTSNRIKNAEFTLNGVKYVTDKNNGANSLHGGKSGYDFRNWKSTAESDGVRFTLFNADSESGYPGHVNVEVFYRIDAKINQIAIEYKATTTKPTPIDLTNHAYFNLNGNDSGVPIYNHEIKINSDYTLASNPVDLIVTGELKPVDNTKYDLRGYVKLSDRIEKDVPWPQNGYDNYFVGNQQTGKRYYASVRNPSNGIKLDIWSDQNGIQFYTGNFLNLTVPSTGLQYGIHSGFCLESQNYPDAVNHSNFPSSIVLPEGEYGQKTVWLFSVEN